MAEYTAEKLKLRDGRELTLRHCGAEDAEKFLPFVRTAREETAYTNFAPEGKEPPVEQVAERWRRTEGDPDRMYLGAFDGDGRLVGQLMCFHDHPGHPWLGHVAKFAMIVLKEFWGQGLGGAFLTRLRGFALDRGVARMEATVRENNHNALALYFKHGFEIEGVRHAAALIGGEYVNEYFIAADYSGEGPSEQIVSDGRPHHIEIYVSDFNLSRSFWEWLLVRMGYRRFQEWDGGASWIRHGTYFVIFQAPADRAGQGFHRRNVGLNHIAFRAGSPDEVDRLTEQLDELRIPVLYREKHPHAAGEETYAVFFEDPDGIKIEVVANR